MRPRSADNFSFLYPNHHGKFFKRLLTPGLSQTAQLSTQLRGWALGDLP